MTAREDWIDRARSVSLVEAARELGAKLKGRGEMVGPCPRCGGKDRFSINTKKGVWNCRGSEGGGDAISLVMHCEQVPFLAAVERLTGEPPPGEDTKMAAPDVRRERREERREKMLDQVHEERADRVRKIASAADVWAERRPFFGSHAEAYMLRRFLRLTEEETMDLGFIPRLLYRGYATPEAKHATNLGEFPCMVAAVRDVAGNLIAVHRTYLDPERPAKLVPPGDQEQNKAKKIVGKPTGGLIRLGFIGPVLAIGEGIETTLSWHRLARTNEDVSLAAAYSLGNIAGGATGTRPHPEKPGTQIGNGEPDMSDPGVVLPPEVKEVILLGDGDSDPYATKAALMTAGRRWRAEGRSVGIDMADAGDDFNGMLVKRGGDV